MQKLTLTGATMVDTKKNDAIEMIEKGGGAAAHSHGGHSHGGGHGANECQSSHGGGGGGHNHGGHTHSGGGNHSACCAPKHNPVARVVYKPPSKEEITKASNEDIRTSLTTLIRLGGFADNFEPLLKLILEHRPTVHDEILNVCGEDHYSLLHWAAKRGELCDATAAVAWYSC